jgi:hypothetical protein
MTVIINGTTGITNVNGTAAAPAETGTDTDSGIVYGTNTVSLATNGTTALTVDASQNVGIGTSSINSRVTVAATNNYSDTYGIIQAYNTGTSASDNASLTVKNYSGTSQFMQWENTGLRIGSRILTNTGAGNVVFTYGNDTEGMRLTPAGLLQFNSGYGSVATAYGCRAWVNFNGTGTVAIRASGNVSSITDNGVGSYTINFTTAMPDTNYAVVCGNGNNAASNQVSNTNNISSASSVPFIHYESNTPQDISLLYLAVFR